MGTSSMAMKCLALLAMLLTSCVTSAPTVRESDEAPEVASWEEVQADPSCVVPLCDEERCIIWRCQDILVMEDDAHAVVPVRGPGVLRPPLVVGNPRRWWGRTIAAPTHAEPIFEIPWRNWKTRDQRVPNLVPIQCSISPREPFEKHHIFPQQKELAEWFKSRGIDIHAFTIRVPKSFHAWLHSGGLRGGQWNEAWREFMRKYQITATSEDIWRFAGELMQRFGVNGPLVPYYCS